MCAFPRIPRRIREAAHRRKGPLRLPRRGPFLPEKPAQLPATAIAASRSSQTEAEEDKESRFRHGGEERGFGGGQR